MALSATLSKVVAALFNLLLNLMHGDIEEASKNKRRWMWSRMNLYPNLPFSQKENGSASYPHGIYI